MTGTRIRASQGHSVEVDLELTETRRRRLLYHGTGARTVNAIQSEGLRKMRRHHVHLSADYGTALSVGARHGEPVVFEVAAAAMTLDGVSFYLSDNPSGWWRLCLRAT